MKKIISILCHTLYNDKNLNYYIFGGFGVRQIRGTRKYIEKYEYEAWYAITDLESKKVIKKDGITYRLFPAKTLSRPLESYFGFVSSPLMFEEVAKLNPNNTVIHFQGERGGLLHYLLFKFPQHNVVLQYHGYGQPRWLDWLETICITPLERINFPKIRHFFVPVKPRIKYLVDRIHITKKKISTENIGIDFEIFKPSDKLSARNKLRIPKDAFVILYVGHLMTSKGVDKILKVYQTLKKKHPRLYLLLVGSMKTDPLYKESKPIADKIIHIVENKNMSLYYNASDVLCFYGNDKNKRFAGPGIAPTEALACNVNVVSTNLDHFDSQIANKLGFIPKDYQDFLSKVEFLINNPNFKFNPRSVIAPYVSFKGISSAIEKVYRACLTYKNHHL